MADDKDLRQRDKAEPVYLLRRAPPTVARVAPLSPPRARKGEEGESWPMSSIFLY